MLSNKQNPLSYMITNDSKNKKKVLIHFESVTMVSDLSDGLHLCQSLPIFIETLRTPFLTENLRWLLLKIHLCDDFFSVDFI